VGREFMLQLSMYSAGRALRAWSQDACLWKGVSDKVLQPGLPGASMEGRTSECLRVDDGGEGI